MVSVGIAKYCNQHDCCTILHLLNRRNFGASGAISISADPWFPHIQFSMSLLPCPTERYDVLIEFAYKHHDFHLAELESILDMHGIRLGGPQCKIIELPQAKIPTSTTTAMKRPFIILSFPGEDWELHSTSSPSSKRWSCTNVKTKKMGVAEMLSRCSLIKSVVELWGYAVEMDDCASKTMDWVKSNIGRQVFGRVSDLSQSWKITIHTLGTKFTREEQDEMRKKFSYIGFNGQVKMNDPDHEYILIREVEMDGKGSPVYPRHHNGRTIIPQNALRPPLSCYFGRLLCGSRKCVESMERFNLKHRKFLGPTSMDAELSFVMTNFGQVQNGSVVLDPFVGTGSILLSCALRGAYCIGTDIDIRVLRGRSLEENIFSNFDQFNLPRPEILRTDNAFYSRHFRYHPPFYDAIICDPPYGIRAGARKTGSRLETPRPIADKHRHDHIAQTKRKYEKLVCELELRQDHDILYMLGTHSPRVMCSPSISH